MKISDYLKNPGKILEAAVRTRIPGHLLSDEAVITVLYQARFGRRMDFKNPRTFNEKILWLTVNDRNPVYSVMADKYRSKKYIESLIGEAYVPKNLGVWSSTDKIRFDRLPSKYVLKCNHDSGSIAVCKERMPDREELDSLERSLKKNYYWFSREWPYKNISPCIFAEEFIESPSDEEGGLADYKIYCFNGEPYMTCVISNRNRKAYLTFMDLSWNKLPVRQRYPNHPKIPDRPESYHKMLEISKVLSKGMKFIRVDFFEDIYNRLYVGELTFTPSSGLIGFEPDEFDYELGKKIIL